MLSQGPGLVESRDLDIELNVDSDELNIYYDKLEMKLESTRKYTPEEKQQLIQNLDIEVEHRVRQLEEWLAVALDNFRLHQEALVSRIPKLVRDVSMVEFADTYDGDVQACLRGLQRARMGGPAIEIDRETRKRTWAAAQEEVDDGEHRATKNARLVSPKKVASPSKTTTKTTGTTARPPARAAFVPTMVPAKAPVYPTLRAPRHDEHMLSVNGSPLANPYALGLGWFTGEEEAPRQRAQSILVRRDVSDAPPRAPSPAPPGSSSARVSIPTTDGHRLEFDPLTTSPGAFDKLIGITDSAKKQAKEEMARLVREAVRKWVIE